MLQTICNHNMAVDLLLFSYFLVVKLFVRWIKAYLKNFTDFSCRKGSVISGTVLTDKEEALFYIILFSYFLGLVGSPVIIYWWRQICAVHSPQMSDPNFKTVFEYSDCIHIYVMRKDFFSPFFFTRKLSNKQCFEINISLYQTPNLPNFWKP